MYLADKTPDDGQSRDFRPVTKCPPPRQRTVVPGLRLQFLPDPPSSIGGPALAGDGIRIPLPGLPGRTLTLEQSTDLHNWTPVQLHGLMFPEDAIGVNLPDEPAILLRKTP